VVRTMRALELTSALADGFATLADQDGTTVTVALVTAPSREADVKAIAATLPRVGSVIITGDHDLPRALLAEDARLGRGLTVVIAEPGMDDEAAETLILSGRADAVAR